jgi:dTDP-glucose 4,6-dehydratase
LIVVHFAAETHVDRSIQAAADFIRTDVFGTYLLLEAARRAPHLRRFIQISSDEVYGSGPDGASRETDGMKPRNPYAASKAGADGLAYNFWATYGVPVCITRASNNYVAVRLQRRQGTLFGDGAAAARVASREGGDD